MSMGLALSNRLGKTIVKNRTASLAIGCGIFVILMVLGAYIRIPLFFTPVPITLQTFFVLLSGAMLGRKWGTLSQISYLLLGAFGLPVFQGYGAGAAHIFGPTGGYLFGFVCASYLIGYFLHRDESAGIFKILVSMTMGLIVIYAFGIMHLKLLLGVDLSTAFILGLYPFLPGAAVKLIAASSIIYGFPREILTRT